MSIRPKLVQPIKVARAYEQLAALLRERIASGDLRPGDRLPSESNLADQANVSRSTVREALRILQEGGLVERSSPRILVVADRSDGPGSRELRRALGKHNVTFHHLYEALMVIDPELARFAAIRADRSDVKQLKQALATQEEHLDHLGEWSRLDVEFHTMIAQISGNPALIVARELMSPAIVPALYRFMDTRDMAALATEYHRRIVQEIEIGDPETAAAVMRRHTNDWRAAWEKRGLDLHQEIIAASSYDDHPALGPAPEDDASVVPVGSPSTVGAASRPTSD